MCWHTDTLGISQVSLLAKASNHAVLGAEWTWLWIGTGWSAGGSTGLEFFVVRARGEAGSRRDLLVDFWVGLTIALVRLDTLALRVLQESLLTETPDDTLEGTGRAGVGIGAGWSAGRTALKILSVGTASFIHWKSWDSDSEADGGEAKEQSESKARVHR